MLINRIMEAEVGMLLLSVLARHNESLSLGEWCSDARHINRITYPKDSKFQKDKH